MKIGIVGCGLVGSTAAYALVMQGIGRKIVLVNKTEARARAEADDILHAVPFAHPLQVSAGSYGDLVGSRVVIIAAGVHQEPGETRLQLLERNAAVFREVVPHILTSAPEAILVVATNPVDVMTNLTARYAADFGVPSGRVIGSGTTLDTARFRTLLAAHVGVDPHHVHAYVVGEHGDSEVLTWSLVTIAGTTLDAFCRLHIIAGKGATYYGIGSALARLVDVITHDQRAILTVCTLTPEVAGISDVTVSLPRLAGGEGILATLPLPLNGEETAALRASAQVIRDVTDSLKV
jgi:L-lactate dehydrogenase